MKTSQLPRFDIIVLQRNGLLEPGSSRFVHTTRGKKLCSTDVIQAGEDHIIIEFVHDPLDGKPRLVRHLITLTSTPCNFGGERKWFSCPSCLKRAGVIYKNKGHFECRKCCDLTYPTQCFNEMDRSAYKARKIRLKLGGSGSLGAAFPPRPKGMHQRTYDRLHEECRLAERRFLAHFLAHRSFFNRDLVHEWLAEHW